MSRLIKAEYEDLGPHNGMGESDTQGSYTAIRLTEHGDTNEAPQSLTFLIPTHQITNPTEDSIHTRIRQLIADGQRIGLQIAVSVGRKEHDTNDS